MPGTFHLDKAIAAWRRPFEHNRAFSDEDIDELADGLRGRIAALVEAGRSEEAAFREAVGRVGAYGTAETEYRKVYRDKRRRRGEGVLELAWRCSMLKNYLKIALRTLNRRKGFAFINIAGLATGLTVCFLILLFVRHERSYDRFHPAAERIYRVVTFENSAVTPGGLAPALMSDFPEVDQTLRLSPQGSEVLVTHEGASHYEQPFFFADSTFFDLFHFPLVQGDPATALTRPFTVVITEEMARKYFGDQDPIGKTLNLKGSQDAHDFEITGVARTVPSNSHLRFNFLASYVSRFYVEPEPETIEGWTHVRDYTYVRLDEGANVAALTAQMPAFVQRHIAFLRDRDPADLANHFTFQPVTGIHLYSHLERELEANSDVRYLYVFSAVALLILLIACINYMNLATARAMQRAREVGVRKVVGAHRRQLMGQFLVESLLQIGVAVGLALLLVALFLPAFNGLLRTGITLDAATAGRLVLVAVGVGGLVGVVAGLYPAAVLSRFQPVLVLKGRVGTRATDAWFRHGLVVVQFAASVALIAGTITIQRQLDYMQQKRLGLNPEQVVVVSARSVLGNSYAAFKDEVLKHPGTRGVTTSSRALPSTRDQLRTLWTTRQTRGEDTPKAAALDVGIDFLKTLEIPLVEGRDLLPEDLDRIRAGEVTPVLINEAAVREFGWTDPIGQEFACCSRPTPRVVGVVEDFHFQSLKEAIGPVVLAPDWWSQYILIRVQTDDLPGTLAFIEDRWEAMAPGYPFEFTFMDDHFTQVYDAEERLAQTFALFSLLAVLIACLGLFGLAAFMAQRRTKEVGIRKALGATAGHIVVLLSTGFLKLALLAILVAAAPAYFALHTWLQGFAYRIDVGAGVFLLTGALVLLIALTTVSGLAVKAALADPVKSLRYE